MQVQEIKDALHEIFTDNGIIDNVQVAASINPQRDVLRLAEIVRTMYEWVDGAIKAERAARSRLIGSINELREELKSATVQLSVPEVRNEGGHIQTDGIETSDEMPGLRE